MLRAWSRWLCEISKASTRAIPWPCPSSRCWAWLPLIPASNNSRTPRAWTSYLEDVAGRSPPCLEWTGLSFVFQTKSG